MSAPAEQNSVRWIVTNGNRDTPWGKYASAIHRVAHGGKRTLCGKKLAGQPQIRRGTWEVTCRTCRGHAGFVSAKVAENPTGILRGETEYMPWRRHVTAEEVAAGVAKFLARGGQIRELEPTPDPVRDTLMADKNPSIVPFGAIEVSG